MKITDVEVIRFRTVSHGRPSRWGYGVPGEAQPATAAVTRVSTDAGVAGHMLGGDPAVTERVLKPLLVGEDPLDREKLWHWMDQMTTFGNSLSEHPPGSSTAPCGTWRGA